MAVTYDAQYALDTHWNSDIATSGECRTVTSGVFSGDQKTLTVFNYFSNTATVGDYIAFGAPTPWKVMTFNIGTARNGTCTVVLEYYNGSAWVTATGATDNTNGFQNTGVQTIVVDPEQMPGWSSGPITGFTQQSFRIRMRLTAVTSLTVGGAQQTDKLKYNSNRILVDGYTSGSPATLAIIKTANDSGGWGVVDQYGTNGYHIKAHLDFGATGYFADTSKQIMLGTNNSRTVMTSIAGATQIFGTLSSTSRVVNGCEIFWNNPTCGGYPAIQSNFSFYGCQIKSLNPRTVYWKASSGFINFIGTNLDINNCIYGTGINFIRTNINNGYNYMFTNLTTTYTDVKFGPSAFNIDPEFYPELSGCTYDMTAQWVQIYQGTAGGARQVAVSNTNGTFNSFSTVHPTDSTANQNSRVQLIDAMTYDLNVVDGSNVAIQNALVYIKDANIAQNWVDSTTTVTAIVDNAAWGQTTVSVASGAAVSIGDYIRIQWEIMLVTNIVANTLTVTRAQGGSYLAKHPVGASVFKSTRSLATDVNGDIAQAKVISRNAIILGTSTPAPNNTGLLITESKNPYTITTRKYGKLLSTLTKTISKKTTDSVILATDSIITITNEATVGAYTGISINHSTQTITITSDHTINEIYDYCKWNICQSSNMPYADFFTSTDGVNFTSTYDLTLSGGNITGTGNISLGAKTLTRTTETSTLPITYNSGAAVFGSITISGLTANSRVRLNNTTDNIELYNAVVGATSVSIPATWTGNKTLDLRVTYVNGATAKLPFQAAGTLTSTLAAFTVSQVDDAVYIANAVDGSTVTEFITDYPSIQVDIQDPDGVTSVQRLYAWFQYSTHTSQGIVYYFNGIVAQDSVNYKITVSVVNLLLDNTSPTSIPCKITGAYLFRDDGTTVIYSGSKSIQLDPSKAYIANSSYIQNEMLALSDYIAFK